MYRSWLGESVPILICVDKFIFADHLTDVTLIIKDGQQFKAHWVIMLVTIAMVHTYYMELQDRQARDFLDFKLGAKSLPPLTLAHPWPPAPFFILLDLVTARLGGTAARCC